jgi:hypothetical protein
MAESIRPEAFVKRTVWVCRKCADDWYCNEPGDCPIPGCHRRLVERHRWVCTRWYCGWSYPGNRKPPKPCAECGGLRWLSEEEVREGEVSDG